MKMLPLSTKAILLTLSLAIIFSCCRKTDIDHTTGMNGVRKWHRYTDNISFDYNPVDSASNGHHTYFYPDTVFALTIPRSNTITLSGDDFTYLRTDASRAVIYFGSVSEYESTGTGRGFEYYYNNDSIVFIDGYRSHHYQEVTVFYTYK